MLEQFKKFVGIDVSKLTLNVAVCDSSRKIIAEFELDNRPPAIRAMLVTLKKTVGLDFKETIFCLEHTGDYCYPFLEVSIAKGLQVWMENPRSIKKGMGLTRGKSDKADARHIATYACRFIDKVRIWTKPPSEVAELRALFSERTRILKTVNILSAPGKEAAAMGNLIAAATRKFSADAVKELKAAQAMVEARMAKIVSSVPEIKKNMGFLLSIKGIGPETALMFIIYTRNFTLFAGPKQFACFCGVAPFPNSSGTSVRGKTKVSQIGNKAAKAVLTMAAWSASQDDPELHAYHARRVGEGMEPSSSINIIRNKLIGRAFAVIRRQEPFQADWNPAMNQA